MANENGKRGAKPAPEGESKADKFRRIGTPRINNAIKTIGLLESMANKGQYEYTDEQRRVIEQNLDTAVQRVKDAFAGKSVAAGGVSL